MYPVHIRGTAVGFHQTVKAIPSIVAPFLTAFLLENDSSGKVSMFLWAVALAIGASSAAFLVYTRNLKNKNQRSSGRRLSVTREKEYDIEYSDVKDDVFA